MSAPDIRQPQHWETYPGDKTAMVGEIKGPDSRGRLLTAVVAGWDDDTDTTRVGFVYQPRCSRCLGLITEEHPGRRTESNPLATRVEHTRACPTE